MKTEEKKLENGDLQVILTFNQYEQNCLYNDLVNISDWYSKGPSEEKIYGCKERMLKQNKDLLMKHPDMLSKTLAEVNAVLEDPVKCVELICMHPEYKNRAQREEEARKLLA